MRARPLASGAQPDVFSGLPIRAEILTADDFNLAGYAVAVITLPG